MNLLKTLGQVLNIDDSLLGLTVLALGNSISDLFADISVANQGYPQMAIAGCFCSPMFQLLIGLGAGLLIQNIQQGSVNLLETMSGLPLTLVYLTFITLLLSLISSLIVFKADNL